MGGVLIGALLFVVGGRLSDCSREVKNVTSAFEYLVRYQYMDHQSTANGALNNLEDARNAIKDFQHYAHIAETGVIDKPTLAMMNMPRCGNPEGGRTGSVRRRRRNLKKHRQRRYILQGSKWPKRHLTYRITKYSYRISKNDVDRTIEKAFRIWSELTPLTFTRDVTSRKVDINIGFGRYRHDVGSCQWGDSFDGPGHTVGHAFYPNYGGKTHFDDDEQWMINSYKGTDLLVVALHEFGHALGLSHSNVYGALMFAFYRGYDPNFKMPEDDTRAIQALYGKPRGRATAKPPVRPQPPTVKPMGDDACKDGKIDAVVTTEEGVTYAFRGKYFYYLDPEQGYMFKKPMLITAAWPGLPNNIDAALGSYRGHTYFFKSYMVYKYQNKTRIETKPIAKTLFEDLPAKMDAIFEWGGNGNVYAVKGKQYWKVGGGDTYPRALDTWKGLPSYIDAAMLWPKSGFTYFFSGPFYYRFNDRKFAVDYGYPKRNRKAWFQCDSNLGALRQAGEMFDDAQDVWLLAGESPTISRLQEDKPTLPPVVQKRLSCESGGSTVGLNTFTVMVAAAMTFFIKYYDMQT